MLEAKVGVSLSHGENFPKKFIDNSRESIGFVLLDDKLTPEKLNEVSCVLIYNPREPFSKEEIEKLKKYDGGIVLITDYRTREEYETFKKNDLIDGLFSYNLMFRQFLPEIDFGEFELTYKKPGFLSSVTKKSVKRVKLNSGYFSREIVPLNTLQFFSLPDDMRIDENDRIFTSFFKNDIPSNAIFLRRETEMKVKMREDKSYIEGLERLLKEYILEEKEDGIYYLVHSSPEFSTYKIFSDLYIQPVGVISSKGYGVALSTDKLLEEIEKKSKWYDACQKFMENVLVWVSQPTIHKFKKETFQKTLLSIREKQVLDETKSKETSQPTKENGILVTLNYVISEVLFNASELGRLLERGTLEQVISQTKKVAEMLLAHGDQEGFGSTISYFYNKFDQISSLQGAYQIPGNSRMEEVLKLVPELNKDKENLHKLIERIISRYKEMRE